MFVHVPSRRKPRAAIATYALVALSVAMFVAWRMQPMELRLSWVQALGVIPADWVDWPTHSAGVVVSHMLRLASALFVHADGLHLVGNVVFLLVFGASAEKPMGAPRLLALFLICGMCANLAGALWYATDHVPIIGASGAVSALVGAYATLFPRSRLGLMLPLGALLELVRMPAYSLIGLWVLVQALMFVLMPGGATVAWPVHLAGFACGVAFALLSRNAIARRLRN
jgi:membrane associated rhomboid family serine protease